MAESAEAALRVIGRGVDVVLSDVRLLRERAPDVDVVLMTAFDDMPTVVQAKYLSVRSVRVSFTPGDLEAVRREMACHRTQYSEEVMRRVFPVQTRLWDGAIALAPAFSLAPGTDLFR